MKSKLLMMRCDVSLISPLPYSKKRNGKRREKKQNKSSLAGRTTTEREGKSLMRIFVQKSVSFQNPNLEQEEKSSLRLREREREREMSSKTEEDVEENQMEVVKCKMSNQRKER